MSHAACSRSRETVEKGAFCVSQAIVPRSYPPSSDYGAAGERSYVFLDRLPRLSVQDATLEEIFLQYYQ